VVLQDLNSMTNVRKGQKLVTKTSDFYIIYLLHWDNQQLMMSNKEKQFFMEHQRVTAMRKVFPNRYYDSRVV
jgi:hypothetical protein